MDHRRRFYQPASIAGHGQYRANPWQVIPNWHRCRNADAGLTQLTNGKMPMPDQLFPGFPTFCIAFTIPAKVSWFSSSLALSTEQKVYPWGAEPRYNRTRVCRTANQHITTKLSGTLMSNTAPFWSTVHLTELRCILLSYSASYWATLHPSELHWTFLSCNAR